MENGRYINISREEGLYQTCKEIEDEFLSFSNAKCTKMSDNIYLMVYNKWWKFHSFL